MGMKNLKKITTDSLNVLVTATGGGGVGNEILRALKFSYNKYNITAIDSSPYSIGLFKTSSRYLAPKATSRKYIQFILQICIEKKINVVIPGSEIETYILAKNKKLFEKNKILLLINSLQVIKLCQDKFLLNKFLESKKINCPHSFLYKNTNSLKQLINYPVIVKPRIGAGSRNVFLAHDKSETIFFANYIKKLGGEPLIQEYVGDSESEYTIGIIYADGGNFITSIAMRRLLKNGLSVRHITEDKKSGKKYVISTGISQGMFEEYEEICNEGIKIAKLLNSNGPINIQCRKTKNGIIPFEINPRFSGTTMLRSLAGLNEPDIFCQYKIFNKIPKKLKIKKGIILREFNEKFISFSSINSLK